MSLCTQQHVDDLTRPARAKLRPRSGLADRRQILFTGHQLFCGERLTVVSRGRRLRFVSLSRRKVSDDHLPKSPPLMRNSLRSLGLAASAVFMFSASSHATNYSGNGSTSFGGPVGNGILSLTSNGTTLTGTITPGPNNGAGNSGELYDELVIYISTGGTGSNSTATFTDDGGAANGDKLREAVSGYDVTAAGATVRSTVNFAPGFNANYAIALSPVGVQYSGVYALPGTGTGTANNFGYLGTANLAPASPTAVGPYTFSISLASIGSPTSFSFATTYLDSHDTDTIYRSGEAFNTVSDVTTPTNTGNPGQDTVLIASNVFNVPEPATWAMLFCGIGLLVGHQVRRRRI